MRIPGLFLAALLLAATQPTLALIDTDSDGIADNIDNCLDRANADQRDTNADGIGNACDPDLNDDCSINFADLQLFKQVFFAADDDADLTGDGFVNFADLSIVEQMFFAAPGPSGGQNECTCVPPAAVGANTEFGGDEVYMLGSLAGAGNAVPGLNDFADQGNGTYLSRLWVRTPGTYDYRIGNASGTIDYCTDALLIPYYPVDVPVAGCFAPGPLELPANACYEFVLDTDSEVLPPSVELTAVQRLGRWNIDVTPAGGTFTVPNGVQLDVPPGAVPAPVTLAIGDLPCQQVDALFSQTTLNSHDDRCLGGFVGEPTGFSFALPVDVTVAADPVTPADEVLIAVSNTPGRQDYTVADTEVTYDAASATAVAAITELSLFAVAGATELNPTEAQRGPSLDPCCSQTPTPLDCCCATYKSTSTMGDATSTDCDCELLANEIVTEFPLCPGAPTFLDRMSHSSENCPTDFVATLDSPDTTLWQCEERVVSLNLTGTNANGQACSMPVPFTWSVVNENVATVEELPPGLSARITGVSDGSTSLNSASNVGTQFSITTPLTIVGVDGPWAIGEDGSQTCVVDGVPTTEDDFDVFVAPVSVDSACSTIEFDAGVAAAGLDGPLTVTGVPTAPLSFVLQATNASNTIGCLIFFGSNGTDTDFGSPFCSEGGGVICQALSCSETITDNGTLGAASTGLGSGDSTWTFNASWSETVDGDTTVRSATCNGSSELLFMKQ